MTPEEIKRLREEASSKTQLLREITELENRIKLLDDVTSRVLKANQLYIAKHESGWSSLSYSTEFVEERHGPQLLGLNSSLAIQRLLREELVTRLMNETKQAILRTLEEEIQSLRKQIAEK